MKVPPFIWIILRLAVAGILFLLLVRSLNLSLIRAQVQQLSLPWVLLSVGVTWAGIWMSALKWQAVLNILAIHRPYHELLLRYWSGTFYNMVLPTSIGGDFVRVRGLVQSGESIRASSLSVLADRATGLWATMLLGLVSSLLLREAPYRELLGMLFGGMVGGGLFALWLLPKISGSLPARLQRYTELARLPASPAWWYIIALGCAFQFLAVLHFYVVARALHASIPLLVCGIYTPAVTLATLLPISINGIGVRETMMVILLANSDISSEKAALMGVLIYLSALVSSLPGGLAFLALPVNQGLTHD